MYTVLYFVIAPTIAVLAGMAVSLCAPWSFPQISLIAGATLLYGCAQYYTVFRPALSVRSATRNKIIRSVLLELRSKLMSRATGAAKGKQIRLNVMAVSGGHFWNRSLEMAVCTDGYTKAEVAQAWRSGEGACGFAWKEKEQVIGTKTDHTSETLNSIQKVICADVKCVLSTPIKPRNRRVQGIMNIDSTECTASQLKLKSQDIQDLVQVYADMIAELY